MIKNNYLYHVQKQFLRQNLKQKTNPFDSEKKKEEIDFKTILEKKINKENNLYLQVLSCLSKIDQDENDKTKLSTKIKELLKNEKIVINDKKLMKIVEIQKNNINDKERLSDEIKKIIDAEMSEEEFVEKKNFRFLRPPHTPDELKKVFVEAEKIYEENKPFLFVNDVKVKENNTETFMKKIPKFFTVRKLVYPETNTEILLCGVRRSSNIHSVFLSKILEKLNPDAIMLHMPPDLPLFIETEDNYKKCKFYF